jgi:hypothetical protein
LLAVFTTGCDRTPAPPAEGASKAQAHAELRREADGSVTIRLHDTDPSHLSLQVHEIASASLAPQVEAYARVLDPAPYVALVAEEHTAEAAWDAASRELARSRRLASDQNVSAHAIETATSAEVAARSALADVHGRLLLGWGTELGTRQDRDELASELVAGKAELIRVDVPSHRMLSARAVHLAFVDAPNETIAAELVGPAPAVDEQLQGQAFLALVSPNTARLAPGAFLSAFLEIDGEPKPAALVPRDAIVRTDGAAWVYVEAGSADTFHRVRISLDRASLSGWLTTTGVAAGDRVVTSGAQQLLSEEPSATGWTETKS